MTKYTNTHKLDRKLLAQKLCDLINDDFEAYEATSGDDYHFIIDRNNKWRVNFSRHDNTYDISYRYGENQMPEQMAIFNERLN